LAALSDAGVLLPVSEAWLRYKAAARYDDAVVVEVRVTELARVRVAFGFRMLHEDGRLLLEAGTVHACTSLEGRPQRWPEGLRAALAAWVAPAGDSASN
jgi:acyl-CoA thioester hydrolase